MAAAETKSPRRAIPDAAKRIFIRVLLFYGIYPVVWGPRYLLTPYPVISIFMVGLTVPSDNPDIARYSGTATTSPFVGKHIPLILYYPGNSNPYLEKLFFF